MKAILVIDKMPVSCDKCEVRCGGYTAKEYSEKSIKRPSWCPLKLLPKRRETRTDIEELIWDMDAETIYALGFNRCLKDITGETE